MKLNFNLEDIRYLRLEYLNGDKPEIIKLALKEKRENDFVAVVSNAELSDIQLPQQVSLSFVCNDGLYKTTTSLNEIHEEEDGFISFILKNPSSLDYQQNREFYRILAEYDCIYTIETKNGIESFNAVTYDLSAGGVSIITSENIIPTQETSLVIFLPERDFKSHLKFVRCEVFNNEYKLSFEFTDLSRHDQELLTRLCVNKQLK